jgi:uncharacterized protein (TIGR03083 family)
MGVLDLWRDGREAMSRFGRTIDDEAAETPVPACPSWTIRDVYAHQAGVTTDVATGNMADAASDGWTARQLAERSTHSLPELLDEWDERAPQLVAALSTLDEDALDPRLLMDLWHHTQDVRGALGLPGELSGDLAEWVLARSRQVLGQFTGLEVVFAEPTGTPTPGTLTVPPFEGARALVGRRSLDQVRAWSWGVDDPDELVARVPVFGPRPEPLVEASA